MPGCVKNPRADALERFRKTAMITAYFRSQKFTVIEMWECSWLALKRNNSEVKKFVNDLRKPLDYRRKMTESQVLKAIRDEKFFGLALVDISTPEALKPFFAEFPPIFKNVDITRQDIGDFMHDYAKQHGLMKKPRRSLISSYFADEILLATPLLNWYISKGLVVTKIHMIIQYDPRICFDKLAEDISNKRREGDIDPTKKLIADNCKLMGNSYYGGTLTNVDNFRDVIFTSASSAARAVNKWYFRELNQIDDDCYEITNAKKTVHYKLPSQIGFWVYQIAKLKMLSFVYDCIDKFIARCDYELAETDTDSIYLSLSGASFEACVKPELLEEYNREKHLWFPRTDTKEHNLYDQRTPGLFKLEWQGDGYICLCSKTYFCFSDDNSNNKFSTKGLNKKQNEITKDKFLRVLRDKRNGGGSNTGFRYKDNSIFTYTQQRDSLSYFYPKREVLSDGISTIPLKL